MRGSTRDPSDDCVEAFRAALREAHARTVPPASALREPVQAFLASSREREPVLRVDDRELLGYAARRLPAEVNAATALSEMHAADVRLAFACARGDGRAIASFDTLFGGDLRRIHARARSKIAYEDFLQALHEKLFVPPQRRIEEYAGRAPMRAWLRVVATRTLLDLARPAYLGERPAGEPTEFLEVPAPGDDPDLAFAKRHYGAAVSAAVRDAARDLSADERNVLREHYSRGLSIDRIGQLRGVHRATAARQVVRARERLLARVRELLVERLGITGRDLDSVLRLVQSAFHLTLERVL